MPAFYELTYYARTFYSGTGGTNDFLVTFYGGAPLDPSHVRVYVNQTEISSGWSFVTINGATYVHIDVAPDGSTPGNVMLRRFTPAREADRVINFTDGDVLTASDLDMSQLNSLYVSQESSDQFLDQGGAGVSINFAETITGSKTFTGTTTIAPEGFFKFTQGLDIIADKTQNGKQYVLGANGITGDVHWEETTINPGSLPQSVVQTDIPYTPQVISAPKTFTGSTVISGGLKVTGTSVSGQALVSNTSDGTVAWSPIVNAIKLGSGTAVSSTGTVVITPASIGALSAGASGGTQTVAGPVTFTGSVGLGDNAAADTLTVQSDLNLAIGNEAAGKVLTCIDANGSAAWLPAAATGITSVNGDYGPTVSITPASLGAAALGGAPQTIAAVTSFSSNVNLGSVATDTVTINAKLKYPVNGYAAGKVLFSQTDGEAVWASLPASVVSVNGYTGIGNSGAVTLSAADVSAVGVSGNQDIGGVKTFTGTAKAAAAEITGTLKYNVGANLQGKVLTSDSSGNATWATTAATGITSINGDYGPTVSITPGGIGAAALGGSPQTIAAVTSFSSNVNLGSVATDTVTINGKLKYPVNGYAAGKVLFSQTDGEAVWGSLPASVASVNGYTGIGNSGAVTLSAADVSAVGVSGNQDIGGVKTFTGTAKAAAAEITGTLKYNVGANLQGKVLTADASGNATWAAPAATGVTSVNNQAGPTVSLSAADVGAVSVGNTQDITGAKTFTNNVTLGTASNDIILIGGELQIPGGTPGQVLMASAGNKAIWQNATASGVTSLNNATGALTISAASLGAYTAQTIPVASDTVSGIMRVGTGLTVSAGVVSVNQNASLPQATDTVLGGIKVGSGLSINSSGVLSATLNGNVGVNKFNTRVGDVLPAAGDYTAAQVTNAVDTNTAQTIAASKKFTALQTVSTATPAVGITGSFGVGIAPAGLIQVQSATANAHVFEAINSTGGVKAWIDSDGDASFDGLVSANGGFYSPAGMSIGQNAGSAINITGTLKILGGGSPLVNKVLTCQDTDGTVAWAYPLNAPVSTVNTMTGAIALSLDGEVNTTGNLGGVTLSTTQTIGGAKTFSANQVFQANVTLGDAPADTILVPGTLKITSGGPGAGKYLQSDALGNASWQTVASAPVTSVNGAVGAITIIADGTETNTTKSLGAVDKTTNQSIGGNKTFTGVTTFSGNVNIGTTTASTLTVTATPAFVTGAAVGRILTCANATTGASQWSDPVAPPVTTVNGRTGTVIITADDVTTGIGAVTTATTQTINGTKTFSANQVFQANVTLGDAPADTILVPGTLKITSGGPGAGKYLQSDALGNSSWQTIASAPVTSVNGAVGAITIIADGTETTTTKSLGAVDKTTNQSIGGNKTFTGVTTFSGNVNIGTTTASTLTVTATPAFVTGAAVGRILTCANATTGASQWSDPVAPPVTSVNGRTGVVVVTADDVNTGIGAVTKSTTQTINSTKTFSVPQTFSSDVSLGANNTHNVTVNGTLVIPSNGGNGKVLTCNASNQGVWTVPVITTVNNQTGTVVITPGNIGAATTADISSLTSQVTAATTAATNASTAAASALSTANSKLSYVSTSPTSVNGTPTYLLTGNGTDASPLQVVNAPPIGNATGDLTGSYPAPTIGANKVTYGKMQQVSTGLRLLGNPAVGATAANVTEISLGAGLGFVNAQLTNTSIPTVSAAGANTFTGANTFQGNVVVGDAGADTLVVNATMSTVAPVTLGAASSAQQITINGPLKITSGTPTAGQVLTCDGSGNATWEQSAANPYTPSVTAIGSTQYYGWATNTNNHPSNPFCFPTSSLIYSPAGTSQLRVQAGFGTWQLMLMNPTTTSEAGSAYRFTITESTGPNLAAITPASYLSRYVLIRTA